MHIVLKGDIVLYFPLLISVSNMFRFVSSDINVSFFFVCLFVFYLDDVLNKGSCHTKFSLFYQVMFSVKRMNELNEKDCPMVIQDPPKNGQQLI